MTIVLCVKFRRKFRFCLEVCLGCDIEHRMDTREFELRKREHLSLALSSENQADGLAELNFISLVHEALPNFNFGDVQFQVTSLGRPRPTPFYVAGMTAGHPDAVQLNQRIARACERRGWAMGVGSQRRQIEKFSALDRDGGTASVDSWQDLRRLTPHLEVFANLGISQLIELVVSGSEGLTRLEDALGDLKPDVIAVHTNPLQEVLQGEGTPHFRNCDAALEKTCQYFQSRSVPIPLLLKETGCGFSEGTLSRLSGLGLAAVDVSGLGGTHWGRIEGARAESRSQPVLSEAAQVFKDWGISTVQSVLNASRVFTKETSPEIWASGGVRNGLDAAKLLALGAKRVGFAKPVLEAALQGEEALDLWMQKREYELKVALFCSGSLKVADLTSRVRLNMEYRR